MRDMWTAPAQTKIIKITIAMKKNPINHNPKDHIISATRWQQIEETHTIKIKIPAH